MRDGPESQPRVVLGFDFGEKRIGIAVGQELTATARGITTLISRNRQPDWDSITRLMEEWQPNAIVVGRPLHLDGTEVAITKLAHRFGNRLAGRYNLPVYTMDERLTSYEAEQQLAEEQGNYSKEEVDMRAAQIILQCWLNQQQSEQK